MTRHSQKISGTTGNIAKTGPLQKTQSDSFDGLKTGQKRTRKKGQKRIRRSGQKGRKHGKNEGSK